MGITQSVPLKVKHQLEDILRQEKFSFYSNTKNSGIAVATDIDYKYPRTTVSTGGGGVVLTMIG